MQGFVGVVDSGVGGLTVLDGLVATSSSCNFVYLADHAFCPYGTKTPDQICHRVLQVAAHLKRMGAVQIVLACNTASLFWQEVSRATTLPVCEVISPTCQAVVHVTQTKRVALLATTATVTRAAYQNCLQKHGICTVCYPCDSFVSLVETHAPPKSRQKTVQERLNTLDEANIDTLILGCTHFQYLQQEIAFCAPFTHIVSSSHALANSFVPAVKTGCGSVKFFTTGDVSAANLAAGFTSKSGATFCPISI